MIKSYFPKNYTHKEYRKDIAIIAMILFTSFLIYFHIFFPEDKELIIGDFIIKSYYYENVQIFLWVLLSKLTYVLSFSLWFITCRHWWRNVLLIPLLVFSNQLADIFNADILHLDEITFFSGLFLSIPIMLITVYISTRLKYYTLSNKMTIELDLEIDQILSKLSKYKSKKYFKLRAELNEIRNSKSKLDDKLYLNKLMSLREELNF